MYLSKNIENAAAIRDKFSKRESIQDIFCVCLCGSGSNLMEIIPSKEIFKTVYSFREYIIIGIAKGKEESFELVKDIVWEYYLKGNISELKENLASRAENLGGNLRWVL